MLRRLIVVALLAAATASAQTVPDRKASVLDVTSIDTTIDPCTDFYTYACGGWLKNNPMPPDQVTWSVSDKVQNENLLILRSILEEAAAPAPDRTAVTQKIGDYYAACMNEKGLQDAGFSSLKDMLQQIAGLSAKADIAKIVARMTYDDVLFDFHSVQDYAESSQVIPELDQGGLSLPDRDFYLLQDEKSINLRKAYLAHVSQMFRFLGDSSDAAQDEADHVLRIETALAKGSMNRLERRDPHKTYFKTKLSELKNSSPAFSWDDYFTGVGVSSLDSLNVADPGFFKAMNQILKREDLNSWKSYLRWHLVHSDAAYLSDEFVNADFDFYGKTLLGAKEIAPRWKRCVNSTDSDLGDALGQAYVEQVFSPQARQRALDMVLQIEAAMQQEIESLSWMTKNTKEHALEKLHAVANKIGYPDKWRDYGGLTIGRDDYMTNVMRSREFEFHRQLAKIGKPVDRGEWAMTPPTVNAYYDSQMNDINFPAGILQPQLFDPDADAAPNYGNTGSTIGHELTHGFDDEGRQFDAQGNLRDWWSPEDAKQFDKRASCIADQYSHYTAIGRIKVNGKLTLGENVADLGGLLLSYLAWQTEVHNKPASPLEGYTPEQRFFLGYAQSWCSETRPETLRLQISADVHSPEQYRVNGAVSNMQEFEKAFSCKPKSPMVRKDQCRIW